MKSIKNIKTQVALIYTALSALELTGATPDDIDKLVDALHDATRSMEEVQPTGRLA